MQVINEGSVRVDLVGGTLDLEPINLILKDVVTINLATSLKAKVVLTKNNSKTISINSKDYNTSNSYSLEDFNSKNLFFSDFFGPMKFVCQIIDLFKLKDGVDIELSSGAPAGSGLGGSSSMGSTLYKALCEFTGTKFEVHEAVLKVKGCEARILNQGVPGYQDYYPALVGGVLALRGNPGQIEFEQLFSNELKAELESRLTLVYSGISRDSGINNWQVYKDFFDRKKDVISSLEEIARISFETYKAIKENRIDDIISLIAKEGISRKSLCESIVPKEVNSLLDELNNKFSDVGLKMCGAGGGGCFILTHKASEQEKIKELVNSSDMKILNFSIENPLSYE